MLYNCFILVQIVKISNSIKQRENDILITNRPFFDYTPLIPELESNGPEIHFHCEIFSNQFIMRELSALATNRMN